MCEPELRLLLAARLMRKTAHCKTDTDPLLSPIFKRGDYGGYSPQQLR